MALSGPDLPVPRVLETGSAPGGAYAISRRCFGVFLETLDEPRWRRLLPALLRGLDALRDAPALGTGALAAAGGPAADFLYEAAWFTFWARWPAGLAAIDIRSAIRGHYQAEGLDVPRFDERLRCDELHIGLTHLAYSAFTGDPGGTCPGSPGGPATSSDLVTRPARS